MFSLSLVFAVKCVFVVGTVEALTVDSMMSAFAECLLCVYALALMLCL